MWNRLRVKESTRAPDTGYTDILGSVMSSSVPKMDLSVLEAFENNLKQVT